MSKKRKEAFGGLDFETAKAMGLGRARAVAIGRRTIGLGNNPESGEPILTADDFRCDAEQAEVDEKGVVRKSRR